MSERRTETITDSQGRNIVLTTLSVLEQYRLRGAIRPELRGDEVANSLATAAASVRSIGTVPVMMPSTPEQLEAIIAKLDDEGWAAIQVHLLTKINEATKAAEASVSSGPLEPSATSPDSPA